MTDLFPDIALGEALAESLTLSFKAQSAISKGDLVKMSTHTSGEIGSVTKVTTAGDKGIGVALKSVSSDEYVPVCCVGIVKVKGSGAIAIGSRLRTATVDAGAPQAMVKAAADNDVTGILGVALQTFADEDDGLVLLLPL